MILEQQDIKHINCLTIIRQRLWLNFRKSPGETLLQLQNLEPNKYWRERKKLIYRQMKDIIKSSKFSKQKQDHLLKLLYRHRAVINNNRYYTIS